MSNADSIYRPEWSDGEQPPIDEVMRGLEAAKLVADDLVSQGEIAINGALDGAGLVVSDLLTHAASAMGDGILSASQTADELAQPLSTAMGEAIASASTDASGLIAQAQNAAVCIDDTTERRWPPVIFNPTDPSTWPTPADVPAGWIRDKGVAVQVMPGEWQLPSWYDPDYPPGEGPSYPQSVIVGDDMRYCPPGTHWQYPGQTIQPAPTPPAQPAPVPPKTPLPPQAPAPVPPGQPLPPVPPYPYPAPEPGQGLPPSAPGGPQMPRPPAPMPSPIPPTGPVVCPVPQTVCPAPQVICPQPQPEQPQPAPSPMPGRQIPQSPEESPYCSIDAYLEWMQRGEGPGTFDESHPIRYLLIGDASEYATYSQRVKQWEGSVNPATRGAGHLHRMWIGLVDTLDGWAVSLVKGSGCSDPRHFGLVFAEALTNIMSIAWGDALRSRQIPLKYKSNSICPVEFPSSDEAISTYLRGEIDEDTLRTWLAQQNKCWEPHEAVTKSQYAKLTPYELLTLWRRDLIDDGNLDRQLRRLGHVDRENYQWYRELAKFVAPITDLIRFMVRDTADESLVKRFGLDDAFTAKWSGDVAKWGKWQGIDDQTARHYWRAHWQIPSPTQLFQMFHRSRSRSPDDPLFTSLDDVKVALQQQDILPFWQSRLLDTTYLIPTRVDARRAFTLGAMSADQLRDLHRRQGYSDADAETLVKYARLERVQSIKNTPRAKSFRYGILSKAAFIDWLARVGLDVDERNQVVNEITEEIRRPWLIRCGKALARRYGAGELTAEQLREKMLDLTLSPEYVDAVVAAAQCERTAKGKHATTSQLCAWFDMGVLGPEEYVDRLRAVGWDEADAIKILRQCSAKVSEKRAREAEKIAKREAAAIEKERRLEEKERKRRETAIRAGERAREVAMRARERRTRLLGRAAEQLATYTGVSVSVAGEAVQQMVETIRSRYLLTQDQIVQSIVLAVEQRKPATLDLFRAAADQLALEIDELGAVV